MEKIKKNSSNLENENTIELVLLDSVTEISNLIFRDSQKIITLDYITHKTLNEKKIKHETSDNYISELEKKSLFDYVVSCAEWYKKIPNSKNLEFQNVNLLGSMNEMEFHLEFLNKIIKIYTISNILSILKPKKLFISSNLKNYVEQFSDDKTVNIVILNKNTEQGFNSEQIELRFNFLFKPITLYISKNFYDKLKNIQENFICSIFGLWYKPNSKTKSNMILEFNPSLFSTLLAELSNCKHQTILFNQRRSAVWNWNSIKNLRKNNCKIINPSDLLKTDNKTLEILETKYRSKLSDFWLNEKELELIFSKNGVRFWPIMKDKFKKLYNSRLENFLKHIIISKNILENINLNSILSLNEQGETEKLFFRHLNHKIPTLLLQHSFFKYYDEMYDDQRRYDSEFTYDLKSDYFLLWGSADLNFYSKFGIKSKKLIITGSPKHENYFISQLKTKNNKNNPTVILLALNPMTNFSGLCNVESFLNYEKLIIKLINFLNSHQNIKIIIKLHPGENFHNQILNNFLKLNFPEIPVFQTKSSKKLIQECDLLIHTTPEFYEMSTIMLESMILGKPVIEIFADDKPNTSQNKILRLSFKDEFHKISEIITNNESYQNLKTKNNDLLSNYLSNSKSASKSIFTFLNELEYNIKT